MLLILAMTKFWSIVASTVGFAAAEEDELADFSNNLASDIGPLLALFGESVTKQYLSESTSFLDYFIFAMGPIGIITAAVSTIRLCGHAYLRAFIGRSQEGAGDVEAELCTSTSRDVCELFTKGGIARVLGRPSILELIYDPSYCHDNTAGLFLFRHYLKTRILRENRTPQEELGQPTETREWKEIRKRQWRKPDQREKNRAFALHPNLSLNVGIVKGPRWVFLAVATAGFILQAGVLVLAGAGVWILDWNLSQGTMASKLYAPVMYIIGTILMCLGMGGCAALIGKSTHELYFERVPRLQDAKTRLLWLQPGPQVIGDQSFDPFAYIEKKDKLLRTWTLSWKYVGPRFESYTFVTVLAVLVGYIMQFIGLRGMKAWVSLAQLAITVIMSILRGLLRMQRLTQKDNLLEEKSDAVAGHELDWLAFRIPSFDKDAVWEDRDVVWDITGQYEEAKEVGTQSEESLPGDVLGFRVRLAHLTGHISFAKIDDGECQKWKDDFVKVRAKALKLSAAICHAAEGLSRVGKRTFQGHINLQIKAIGLDSNGNEATTIEKLVYITLKPPSQSTQASWTIDSARLEAILGLWIWSMFFNKRHKYPSDSNHYTDSSNLENHDTDSGDDLGGDDSPAEKIQKAWIITAGRDNESWGRVVDRQTEMDLWLGSNAVPLGQAVLGVKRQHSYGFSSLWWNSLTTSDDGRTQRQVVWTLSKDVWPRSNTEKYRMFCGWNPVYEFLASDRQEDQEIPLRVQTYSTCAPLLDICAQELFVSLTMSLAKIMPIGNTTFGEDAGSIRLENPTIDALVKAFTEAGLGSSSDALLCIIPAFRNRLPMLSEKSMLSVVVDKANHYRRQSEWRRAETLLRWVCQYSSSSYGTGSSSPMIGEAIRALGELYRWSLAQYANDERHEFGSKGIDWIYETYSEYRHIDEVTVILDNYKAVKEKVAQIRADDSLRESIHDQLVKALKDRNRGETLGCLCFATTDGIGTEKLQPILPLAVRNNWGEVISSVLELRANPNSRDEDGRTAISYCAELGYDVKPYLDRGALTDVPDKDLQTALHWAAKKGYKEIMELLLEKGAYIEAKDSDDQTPLSVAAVHGHAELVDLLLQKNASVDSKDKHDWTPLSHAAANGHKKVVELLLRGNAGVNHVSEKDGLTPLALAAKSGHEAVVELLIAKGATIEVEDNESRTPLALAAWGGPSGGC